MKKNMKRQRQGPIAYETVADLEEFAAAYRLPYHPFGRPSGICPLLNGRLPFSPIQGLSLKCNTKAIQGLSLLLLFLVSKELIILQTWRQTEGKKRP